MFRVSIILACYNVENFIEDAFESIVRQSAFADFEVIPVNDGSTDSTQEIIDKYQRKYPENFFPISFESGSGGPGRPRNAGIEAARAPYIIFMDPDDRIHEDGYSLLLSKMESYDSDIVIATRFGVPEKMGAEKKVWTDYVVKNEIINEDSYGLKVDLLSRRPVILKSIYRTSLIREHGLRFLEGVTSSEDEIFDMKYLLLSKKITKINDVVYLYTVARTGSITSKIRLKVYEDLPAIFDGLDDALSVYFNQAVVSYRLAALLRTFYYPKLLLLDPDHTDEALEITRRACEAYGFDKLLMTENSVDRRMLELLRDRQFSQLMLYFMNQRNSAISRTVRAQNRRLRTLNRRPLKAALRLSNYARSARRAIEDREPAKYLRANLKEGGFKQASNGYWLFMDRRDKASDNAEALYRYVRENGIHDRIAFVISQRSPDYARLQQDGFNVVPYDTVDHWRLLYGCDHFFASHVDDVIIVPWREYGAGIKEPRYKLNFLQHGIIRSDLSGWLGAKTYNLFCSSTKPEYESLLNNLGYRLTPDELKLTGLARHDLLERRVGDYILVSPTWRSFLTEATAGAFTASEFYSSWNSFLHHPRLTEELRQRGLRLKFVLHASLSQFAGCFRESDTVEVLSYKNVDSFSDLISGAQLMVTDYSTISFDTLYLRRPVIYYTFPETQAHSTNMGKDLSIYESMGQCTADLDVAVDALITAAANNFAVDEQRLEQIDDWFAFDDNNNRKRIIDAVLEKEPRA